MAKEKLELNINDLLYKYVGFNGIFTYKVLGKREYSNIIQYEIECQDCRDHAKCRLLICQDDNYKRFKYICMIDEDEDIPQNYWHNDSELHFFLTKSECKKQKGQKILNDKKKEIEKQELRLKQLKDSLIEIENWMKS